MSKPTRTVVVKLHSKMKAYPVEHKRNLERRKPSRTVVVKLNSKMEACPVEPKRSLERRKPTRTVLEELHSKMKTCQTEPKPGFELSKISKNGNSSRATQLNDGLPNGSQTRPRTFAVNLQKWWKVLQLHCKATACQSKPRQGLDFR